MRISDWSSDVCSSDLDIVDADARRADLERDGPDHSLQRTLARRVDRRSRHRTPCKERGGVDDHAATTLRKHRLDFILDRQPDALEVDAYRVVELNLSQLNDRLHCSFGAGIVEGDVVPAELRS